MSLYKHYLSVKNDVPSKGYWDMYLIDRLFEDFIEVSNLDDVSESLVIIAGAYQFDVVDKINKELSKLDKCIVIVTSDEENKLSLGRKWFDVTYPERIKYLEERQHVTVKKRLFMEEKLKELQS